MTLLKQMAQRGCLTIAVMLRGHLAYGAACVTLLISPACLAANASFQDFFFSVCQSPTAQLAARCAETVGGVGNLSGDSESSLNPSQSVAITRGAESAASQREGEYGDHSLSDRLSFGRFSLLLNGRRTGEKYSGPDSEVERDYKFVSTAFDVGADYRASPSLVLGFLLSANSSVLDFAQEADGRNFMPQRRAGQIDHDSYGATIFAAKAFANKAYVDVSAGYLWDDYQTERQSLFQESNRVVPTTTVATRSDTQGTEFWAAASIGYVFTPEAWAITPSLTLHHAKRRVDAYEEQDISQSGLALAVSKLTHSTTLLRLGFNLSHTFSTSWAVLQPQLNFDFYEQLNVDAPTASVTFLQDDAAQPFALSGVSRDSTYGVLGVGLSAVGRSGWSGFVQFNSHVGLDAVQRSSWVLGLRKVIEQ